MADIGHSEVHTMAQLIATGSNLIVSASDAFRIWLDKDDPFWVKYEEAGGRLNDTLFVPEGKLEEFQTLMINHQENGQDAPLKFCVSEKIAVPVSENAVDEHTSVSTGPIPKFDENGRQEFTLVKDATDLYTERPLYVANEEVAKIGDPNVFIFDDKICTTDESKAKQGPVYTKNLCRIIVPEGKICKQVPLDKNGQPVYDTHIFEISKDYVEQVGGGVSLQRSDILRTIDNSDLAKAKMLDRTWALNKEDTVRVEFPQHDDLTLFTSVLADRNINVLPHVQLGDKDHPARFFAELKVTSINPELAKAILDYQLTDALYRNNIVMDDAAMNEIDRIIDEEIDVKDPDARPIFDKQYGGVEIRIPNSDKIIERTINRAIKEAQRSNAGMENPDNPFANFALQEATEFQRIIEQEKIYMQTTPVSRHVASASYLLKDEVEQAIDNNRSREYEPQESLREYIMGGEEFDKPDRDSALKDSIYQANYIDIESARSQSDQDYDDNSDIEPELGGTIFSD